MTAGTISANRGKLKGNSSQTSYSPVLSATLRDPKHDANEVLNPQSAPPVFPTAKLSRAPLRRGRTHNLRGGLSPPAHGSKVCMVHTIYLDLPKVPKIVGPLLALLSILGCVTVLLGSRQFGPWDPRERYIGGEPCMHPGCCILRQQTLKGSLLQETIHGKR